jgi:hypothetical protein
VLHRRKTTAEGAVSQALHLTEMAAVQATPEAAEETALPLAAQAPGGL